MDFVKSDSDAEIAVVAVVERVKVKVKRWTCLHLRLGAAVGAEKVHAGFGGCKGSQQ